jgi:hypothetical protein
MSTNLQFLLSVAAGILGTGLQMTESKLIGVALIVFSLGWIWWLLLPIVAEKYEATQSRPPAMLWGGWIAIMIFCLLYGWGIYKQQEDQKPKFSTRIRGSYVWYSSTHTANLLVLLEIGNSGNKPSVATDFTLTLQERSIHAHASNINGTFHFVLDLPPNHTDIILLAEEFIQRRCTANPITLGASVRGWLYFEIPKSPDVATENASITFSDILDQTYSIPLRNIQRIPPLPSPDPSHHYPDITYPFRERSVIERMIQQRGSDTLKIYP